MRQMLEYKREKGTLEKQVVEMEKRAKYHDDHLRIIDMWFSQVCSPRRNLHCFLAEYDSLSTKSVFLQTIYPIPRLETVCAGKPYAMQQV